MSDMQSVTQHRTQVYFPKSIFNEIKKKSLKEEVSIAEIIRRAVVKEINGKVEGSKKNREKAWEKLFASAGIGKGPKDLSYNHDKYFVHK